MMQMHQCRFQPAQYLDFVSRSFSGGLWRLADPKISLASMASLLLGACAAAREGPLSFGWLAVTIAGIFAIEVGKNASGEIFDVGTDSAVAPEDRSPFSGGKRVLVDGLVTKGETAMIAAAGYALGAAAGLAIVLWREPRVLWFGLAGLAMAYSYNGPPFRLAYRGLGEAAVALCYGPLIACGACLVQRGRVTSAVLLASVPLGLLIAAFLWINEFPDFLADRQANKRNLVVRMGRRRASRGFVALVAAALVLVAALPALGLPEAVWLGVAGFVPAALAARVLVKNPETTAALIPAQARALLSFVLMSAGTGVGLIAGPR